MRNETSKASEFQQKALTYSSVLLAPYAQQLNYAFTGKGRPLGGNTLSEPQRQAYRENWCEQLGMNAAQLIVPQQSHGARWAMLSGIDGSDIDLSQTDALIVETPQQPALIQTADCVPILLYVPSVPVVAAIHAGWRGTAANISTGVVKALQQRYNIKAEAIIAVIGPSISLQAYEVGEEVEKALAESLKATDSQQEWLERLPHQKPKVDVARVNKLQLLEAGVKAIERLPYCTFTLAEQFYSHRRGDGLRQGLLVELRG